MIFDFLVQDRIYHKPTFFNQGLVRVSDPVGSITNNKMYYALIQCILLWTHL